MIRATDKRETWRVAVLSDIHGNLVALDAVLADMAQQGPFDETVVAGDLVWSGPWPAEVVDRVSALKATVIEGNTDAYFRPDLPEPPPGKDPGRFETQLAWMRAQLGPERVAFVGSLPFSHRISPADRSSSAVEPQPDENHDLLIVHANPSDLERPIMPQMRDGDLEELLPAGRLAGCEVLAFGHVHIPFIRQWRGRLLVNVSSAGLPMDGDPRAVYAILEWDGVRWRAEHRRVFYNVPVVAHQMRTCGMPRGKHFADRLMAARYNQMIQLASALAD